MSTLWWIHRVTTLHLWELWCYILFPRGSRDRDRIDSSIKYYVIRFISDLPQVGGFLLVLRFSLPIKLNIAEILLKVKLNPIILTLYTVDSRYLEFDGTMEKIWVNVVRLKRSYKNTGSVVCLTTKGRQLERNFEELKPASHVPILGTI